MEEKIERVKLIMGLFWSASLMTGGLLYGIYSWSIGILPEVTLESLTLTLIMSSAISAVIFIVIALYLYILPWLFHNTYSIKLSSYQNGLTIALVFVYWVVFISVNKYFPEIIKNPWVVHPFTIVICIIPAIFQCSSTKKNDIQSLEGDASNKSKYFIPSILAFGRTYLAIFIVVPIVVLPIHYIFKYVDLSVVEGFVVLGYSLILFGFINKFAYEGLSNGDTKKHIISFLLIIVFFLTVPLIGSNKAPVPEYIFKSLRVAGHTLGKTFLDKDGCISLGKDLEVYKKVKGGLNYYYCALDNPYVIWGIGKKLYFKEQDELPIQYVNQTSIIGGSIIQVTGKIEAK